MARRAKRAMVTPAAPDRTPEEVSAIILANKMRNADHTFEGLTSSEIAENSRRLMFGENDEAFPDPETWSAWVD